MTAVIASALVTVARISLAPPRAKLLRHVLRLAVDIAISPKLEGQLLLVLPARDGHGVKAELRRELPRSSSLNEATEALYKHLRRVVPMVALGLYRPRADANELAVVAACGTGSAALDGLVVPIAERISGWVFANGQSVLNSDATLELGPVAGGRRASPWIGRSDPLLGRPEPFRRGGPDGGRSSFAR